MTAPSSTVERTNLLPPIDQEKREGIKPFGWCYDTARRLYYATHVIFVYSSGGQDFHYSVDVMVSDDEIDLYTKEQLDSIVASRVKAVRTKLLGVQRATRRKYGLSRRVDYPV